MANRPVFVPAEKAPFVSVYMPEFTWNGGFAVSQKQKNITALHNAFHKRFAEKKILEISSKSMQDFGIKMSAFNLKKEVPSLERSVPVECVFQGSKVFSGGGAFTELYEVTPKEAKKSPLLKSSGALISFCFEGKEYPIHPKTVFYDWIYINAILENPGYAEELLNYDSFTDIEFNPEKSINCQARSAALFVALHRKGLIEKCVDFEDFIKLFE